MAKRGAQPGNCNAAKNKAACRAKKGKSTAFTVKYDRKVGGTGTVTVKAMSAKEAIRNASNLVHTGTKFRRAKRTTKTVGLNRTRGWRRKY